MRGHLSAAIAALVTFVAAVAVTCALHWPLPQNLDSYQTLSAFHDGHIWCFDYIARMVAGEIPWKHVTREIGYPEWVELRFIVWLPALLAIPFRGLFGPVGAYYAIVMLSPGLVALATWAFLRRATGSGPWTAAAGAVSFALCPYLLGALASGQTAKIQLWIVPLYLLVLISVLGPGLEADAAAPPVSKSRALLGWVGALIGLGAVSAVSSFTSPTTTLQIPLVAGAWIVGEVLRAGRRWWRVALLGVLALGVTAASLLPAQSYYGALRGSRLTQAFQPGIPPSPGVIPDPAPMAQPEAIFEGEISFDMNPRFTSHVTYLGIPILIICALLSIRRFPRRWFAWGGVVMGIVIAMGPKLASGGRYLTNDDGYNYALPAKLLEIAHYPMAESGMYYRVISLANLGLVMVLVGACARIRQPWGAMLAWCIAAGMVYESYQVTAPLWPRPTMPVPGLDAYLAMADDPVEGVVIDLPLETDVNGGSVGIGVAVLHRRKTQSLPRQNRKMQLPHLDGIDRRLKKAFAMNDPATARAWLAERGYRYAVWHPSSQNDWMSIQQVSQGLGPPKDGDGIYYWVFE